MCSGVTELGFHRSRYSLLQDDPHPNELGLIRRTVEAFGLYVVQGVSVHFLLTR